MKKLAGLRPERVLSYFEDICGIPHGSGDTDRISEYCMKFAADHGLEARRDGWNNVIIRKPASPGYEDHPTVILQGHMDMVCEKDPGCTIDFTADGLELRVEGDWISADGTTLGGDDGIAVAMAMAVMEDDTLPHPPLEAVFTTDEETGMYGAVGLDTSDLRGRVLLNLDSESEQIITVGCAGGARANITFPMETAPVTAPVYEITVSGLIGGHSGAMIHCGLLNSNVLMGKLLHGLTADWQLIDVAGGLKDNAIPRQTVCRIATDADLSDYVRRFEEDNRVPTDPGLTITVTPAAAVTRGFAAADSRRAAELLVTVKNGLQAMSADIEGLVETSLNMGILTTSADGIAFSFSVRSAIGARKEELLEDLRQTAEAFGGGFSTRGHYPAWEYRRTSPLRDLLTEIYREVYGRDPVFEVTHGGLECGVLIEKLDGLDAASFGPDLLDIHTSRERMSISSVERSYRYLCAVLARL